MKGIKSEEESIMSTKVEKRGVFEKAGYRNLILWKNLYDLRRLVYEITKSFPKSEYRRISQMRDAARSAKQNLQEGHRHSSRKHYIYFLDIAHASLHELAGDVEDSYDDQLIGAEQFEQLVSLINRTDYLFKRIIESLKNSKTDRNLNSFLLPPRSSAPIPSLSSHSFYDPS